MRLLLLLAALWVWLAATTLAFACALAQINP